MAGGTSRYKLTSVTTNNDRIVNFHDGTSKITPEYARTLPTKGYAFFVEVNGERSQVSRDFFKDNISELSEENRQIFDRLPRRSALNDQWIMNVPAQGDQGNGIPFADLETRHIEFLTAGKIENDLVNIRKRLEKILQNVDKVGAYGLDEISISVGVSAGNVVLTVEGGVTLTFRKK